MSYSDVTSGLKRGTMEAETRREASQVGGQGRQEVKPEGCLNVEGEGQGGVRGIFDLAGGWWGCPLGGQILGPGEQGWFGWKLTRDLPACGWKLKEPPLTFLSL